MYVHSEYRRRGHFRALYQHVQQQAKQEKAAGIRLYVDTHNRQAQETVRLHLTHRELDFTVRTVQHRNCTDYRITPFLRFIQQTPHGPYRQSQQARLVEMKRERS